MLVQEMTLPKGAAPERALTRPPYRPLVDEGEGIGSMPPIVETAK